MQLTGWYLRHSQVKACAHYSSLAKLLWTLLNYDDACDNVSVWWQCQPSRWRGQLWLVAMPLSLAHHLQWPVQLMLASLDEHSRRQHRLSVQLDALQCRTTTSRLRLQPRTPLIFVCLILIFVLLPPSYGSLEALCFQPVFVTACTFYVIVLFQRCSMTLVALKVSLNFIHPTHCITAVWLCCGGWNKVVVGWSWCERRSCDGERSKQGPDNATSCYVIVVTLLSSSSHELSRQPASVRWQSPAASDRSGSHRVLWTWVSISFTHWSIAVYCLHHW